MTPLRQRMMQELQLRGYSPRTVALCGIKFFYQHTLSRAWKVFEVARPRAEKKLPAVLSRDEVARILAAVRIPVYRVCLSTIYALSRLRPHRQVHQLPQ
jgi:integrase/recombinase XerD